MNRIYFLFMDNSAYKMTINGFGRDSQVKVENFGESWHRSHNEGELSVDVLEDDSNIIIVSTIAGAIGSDIEIYVHNDLVTIRGFRRPPVDNLRNSEYHLNECFWGAFSRTIVLPVHVQGYRATADYKNGVLKITIPKNINENRIEVVLVEE